MTDCTILVHPECESKITYGCYQKADRLSKVLIVQFADESTRDMWFDVIYEKVYSYELKKWGYKQHPINVQHPNTL